MEVMKGVVAHWALQSDPDNDGHFFEIRSEMGPIMKGSNEEEAAGVHIISRSFCE